MERAAFNSKLWEAARRGWRQEISGMHSSLSVFHCRTAQGNRNYETRFQWFNFFRDPGKGLVTAQQANLEGMIRRAKEDYHDHVALTGLVKVLEASLERDAYHLFVREFGPEATFFDDVVGSGGIADREGTKEATIRNTASSSLQAFWTFSVQALFTGAAKRTRAPCPGFDAV